MKSYISIDWGGTNLTGIFVKGNINKRFAMPAENIRNMTLENMELIINNILTKEIPDYAAETKIWLIGAAGAGDAKAASKLKESIKRLDKTCENVEVYTDCEANHAACFGGDDGILCVAGTGFMLYGKYKGSIVTGGGYGYLVDMLPSGAFFGQRALEGLLKSMDGFPEYEEYYKYAVELNLIKEGDRKKQKIELLDNLYSSSNYQQFLAKYSVLFAALLKHHEFFAIKACLASFDNLKQVAQEVVEKLYLNEEQTYIYEIPVSLSGAGGLWDNIADFPELCCTAFEKINCEIKLKSPKYGLELGPLALFAQTNEEAKEILKQF